MSIYTCKCPQCSTEHIALNVVAVTPTKIAHMISVHFVCPKCTFPSSALAIREKNGIDIHRIRETQGEISDLNWSVTKIWPEPPKPVIPEHLSSDVERVYRQAESNFTIEGNEEASGTMYRKALDIALKEVASDVKGTLAARITELVKKNLLTPSLGEWADQIRLLGNESAHESDQPTREELESLRNFSNLVLQYLFTLPAKVKARKSPGST
ncbi:MAG: DUF4145 domain-containing protein [Xanthobacteraceae bacterium]|nr:DUF4145 domain-containing protein [Xanthobacteraceae bacterium]